MTQTPSTSKSARPSSAEPAKTTPPGRAYRGVSIEKRRAERREKLLQAGTVIFGSVGFHGTSVRAICAEAGLTERYFYESFSNSEALLSEIYQLITDQIRQLVSRAIAYRSGEPDAMAEAALTAYFEFLHDNPRAARVIMVEIMGVNRQTDAQYRQVMDDFANFLVAVFRGLHPERRHHDTRDYLLATGLIGAMVNMAMRWMLNGYREPVADVVQAARFILMSVNNQLGR